MAQATLSFAEGGLGIESPLIQASAASAAGISSWSEESRELRPRNAPDSGLQGTKDTLLWLQSLVGIEVQPLKDWCVTGQMRDVNPEHKTQRHWSILIHKARKNALLQDASARDMVRLRCQDSCTAGAWSRAPPSSGLGTKIPRDRYRLMLRWHLGMPILPPAAAGKPCPSCAEALDIFGDHAVTCSRGNLWRRHFLLQDYILRLSRAAGFQATREVSLVSSARREADILINNWTGVQPLALDLTIRHPRAPGLPFSDPERVLLRAEEEKRRGAEAHARASDTIFEPLVLHTWSGVAAGGSSKTFLGQWLQRVVENRPGTDKDRKMGEIHEGLSCILFSQIAEQLSAVTSSSEIPVVPSCDLPDRVDEFGNALPGVHTVPIDRQLRLRKRPILAGHAEREPSAASTSRNNEGSANPSPGLHRIAIEPRATTDVFSSSPPGEVPLLFNGIWASPVNAWLYQGNAESSSSHQQTGAAAPAPDPMSTALEDPVDPLLLQIIQQNLAQ